MTLSNFTLSPTASKIRHVHLLIVNISYTALNFNDLKNYISRPDAY